MERRRGRAMAGWTRPWQVLVFGFLLASLLPARAAAQTSDSLIAAAQRAARGWRTHDFSLMLAGSAEVALHLPGSDASAPLRASQAVELLRAYVGPAQELEVEVEVARHVEPARAYVEMRRTYVMRPGAERRSEVVYLALRREAGAYRVAEVRIVP